MSKNIFKTLESIVILSVGLALPLGIAIYNHYHKIQEPVWALDAGVGFYYTYLGLRLYYRKKVGGKFK